MMPLAKIARQRLRLRVRGLVQGVGFRPFVYQLAHQYQLTGWVQNDDAGVLVEVQGADSSTESFRWALEQGQGVRPPPLARIDDVEVVASSLGTIDGEERFEIRASAHTACVSTMIGVDAAPCRACLVDLLSSPNDRRYRYPFINCTHCGPRFTITRSLPYDRPQTSMASFTMCKDCRAEYEDPNDRRFHAQPIACPACGPKLTMSIAEIAERLRGGEIVAVKGVGGFQIACDATREEAVRRLRELKQRDGKPFAIMGASVAALRRFVSIDEDAALLLESLRRPIVLLPRRRQEEQRSGDGLAPSVSPDLAWIGVMLPSSPLHYLLFHELAGRPAGLDWLGETTTSCLLRGRGQQHVLVMTSANPGGEPLVVDDEDAERRLVQQGKICDAIAGHDRPIEIRCDDPVVRIVDTVRGRAPMVIRRGRGYAPEGIVLPREVPCVLAVGAHLKNAVCVTRGNRAYLSQHIGDMDDAETYRFFEQSIEHLCSILEVEPVAVAHDLHPDLMSTTYARVTATARGLPCIAVQHHHAHIAAVLAEHGATKREQHPSHSQLGLALDGVGLGTDGTAWGGELLRVKNTGSSRAFERLGHLAALPLPGGDAAAREPWRMALSALWKMGGGDRRDEIRRRWGARGEMLAQALDRGVCAYTPLATGCGRWFDAACGILGVRDRSGYEGEAPMVLESLVTRPRVLEGGWVIRRDANGASELDLLPLLEALLTMTPEEGADVFHGTLAAALVDLVVLASSCVGKDDEKTIALGGGCVVNGVLTSELVRHFATHGIHVLLPRMAPPGDGGLALGQAWIAAQQTMPANDGGVSEFERE